MKDEKKIIATFFLLISFFPVLAYSQTIASHTPLMDPQFGDGDMFEDLLNLYKQSAGRWQLVISEAASRIFWILSTISMVWTFCTLALRKADIGEFFSEFFKFIMFTGFFWWLLTNGTIIAQAIINGFSMLGGRAAGFGNEIKPSSIIDIGLALFNTVIDHSSVWQPVLTGCGILIALLILIVLTIMCVNMLLLTIASWILVYAGIIFLGFGGSRWTSEMALNYYRTVLGLAIQIMTMILVISVAQGFLEIYYDKMEMHKIDLKNLAVIFIAILLAFHLAHRLPPLVAGIMTGASIGGGGIGQMSFMSFVAGTAATIATLATAGRGMGAAASGTASGAKAIGALAKRVASANSMESSANSGMGAGSSNSDSEDSLSGSNGSAYSRAAGFEYPKI
ncbi:P-type conjugative transfer protein TrbL [Bartonella sp. DGB2]|uniref:P-type conjugative transfer protein TrbL n=1 Tax=Bartonella sp. DGB2 TaxID=3388426 RepID=UPI00398F9A81